MTLHTAEIPVKMALPMSDASTKPDPYAPWRSRDYRCYAYSWFGMVFSKQIETLAVSVYFVNIYDPAEAPLALGLLGLVQALPVMLLAIAGGQIADRFNRRHVLMATLCVNTLVVDRAGDRGLDQRFRAADVHFAGHRGHRPGAGRSFAFGPAASTRAHRDLRQCGCLEQHDLLPGLGHRPCRRRRDHGAVGEPRGCLCHGGRMPGAGLGGLGRDAFPAGRSPQPVDLLAERRGGHPLRPRHQAHPGHDQPRPVCRVAGRRRPTCCPSLPRTSSTSVRSAWDFSARPTPWAPCAWPCCWSICRPCGAPA